MQPVKRVEIITDSLELKELLAAIKACGVTGYSVFHSVTGGGDRGEQLDDDLTGASNNTYLLTTSDAARLDKLLETVRPILKRRGGVCMVSDALWLVH
jgi:hypothetical protein